MNDSATAAPASPADPTASGRTALIAGAGLAGSLLAVLLGRRGWTVDLYERRPDPRARGFIGGRSINLALSTRGITALERAGLAERVLAEAIPMRGRIMHATDGELTFQPYSRGAKRAINSVSRSQLNIMLLEAASELPNVRMHFGHTVKDVDLDSGQVTFAVKPPADGAASASASASEPTTVTAHADLVVAADGAFSAIRARMQRTSGFDYSQSYLEHGYKELTIPPTSDGAFALDEHALHIWPHGGSMMIALPNNDRSFTCTLFWPLEGPHSFGSLPDAAASDETIMAFFRQYYGDSVPLMPTLLEDYRENPTSRLVTVRCAPWHWGDHVALVGDAAHAIVPFYGQGMNAAFEDCRILDEMLEAAGDDPAAVLPAYTRARKPAGDAIADLALDNFITMRDRVTSPWFLARKRLEKFLNGVMPGTFEPLYDMVSFSNVPYHEARQKARRQDRALLAGAIGIVAAGVAVAAVGLTVALT
ncbi:MAG: FAD-dependent oxidoreductase [Phycisphaerales bacterium]